MAVRTQKNNLKQYFSNFNTEINYLGILLKCRFGFSRSEIGGALRTAFQTSFPDDASAAGPWTIL